MKLIHTADLHLDSGDELFCEVQRRVFKKIIELVISENTDMLLIGGDLFDGPSVSRETLNFVLSSFNRIKTVPVFVSCGNHDPKLQGSVFSAIEACENVHIFGTEISYVDFNDEVRIYGVSFGSSQQEASLFSGFKAEGKTSIMLMHANTMGESYNPVSSSDIENSRLCYLALGHIHEFENKKIGTTTVVYPGIPQGRGFDELDAKGAVVAEIKGNEASVRFVPLCEYEFSVKKIDISGLKTYDEIIEKINGQICENNSYKVILCGEREFLINKEIIKDRISCRLVKLIDKTRSKVDINELKNDFSLKGVFIQKLISEGAGENELLKEALALGIAAVDGEKVNLI